MVKRGFDEIEEIRPVSRIIVMLRITVNVFSYDDLQRPLVQQSPSEQEQFRVLIIGIALATAFL